MAESVADAGIGTTFALPSLGADMEVGSVLEWRVGPGDSVESGDVIAVVATEKADIDVEIWEAGVVDELLVAVGVEVPVGTPLLRLRSDLGSVGEPGMEPSTTVTTPGRPTTAASPRARALASERGIELSTVAGSGPDGAVLARDLDGRSTTGPQVDARGPGQNGKPRSMRNAIASAMSRSNLEIPHYFLQVDIDIEPATAFLDQHNSGRSVADRVLLAALLIKATAGAAAKHRELSGWWIDDRFEPSPSVDVAMAVSLRGGGLVTPKIATADQLSLDDVMGQLRQMVTAARTGSLRSRWMTRGSITVTNLGDTGADVVHGVIHPPQVALVGFGQVSRRPWVVEDQVVARPIVTASLAADHRATDGAAGSRFLGTLATMLTTPEVLA